MTRLKAIAALRDAPAMSALNYAIETVRDDLAKWGNGMEAEERAFALSLLGKLIDLQVETDREAVRVGTQMAARLSEQSQLEQAA